MAKANLPKFEDIPIGTFLTWNIKEPVLATKAEGNLVRQILGGNPDNFAPGSKTFRVKSLSTNANPNAGWEVTDEVYFWGWDSKVFGGRRVFKKRPPKPEDITVVNTISADQWHPNRQLCNLYVKLRTIRKDLACGLVDLEFVTVAPKGVTLPFTFHDPIIYE